MRQQLYNVALEKSSGHTRRIGTCRMRREISREQMGEKGMTTSCDINSLFIYMALLVTFPYFVHHLLATNIQRDEQAERSRGTLYPEAIEN
jgi:hypothetical protein